MKFRFKSPKGFIGAQSGSSVCSLPGTAFTPRRDVVTEPWPTKLKYCLALYMSFAASQVPQRHVFSL